MSAIKRILRDEGVEVIGRRTPAFAEVLTAKAVDFIAAAPPRVGAMVRCSLTIRANSLWPRRYSTSSRRRMSWRSFSPRRPTNTWIECRVPGTGCRNLEPETRHPRDRPMVLNLEQDTLELMDQWSIGGTGPGSDVGAGQRATHG